MRFTENNAKKAIAELKRHPDERVTGAYWGRFAFEDVVGKMLEDAPDGALKDQLCEALMEPDHLKLTQSEIRQRKKWDGMAKQAGHPLGDCFETPEGLCSVCATT